MLNYLCAELYKVFCRKCTWITLAVVVVLEALLVTGWASIHVNGVRVDYFSGIIGLLLMLELGFYATLFTGGMVFAGQYKHNTLKNEVAFGISRSRIYLGKLLAQTVLSVLFCVVIVGLYLALCAVTQSHDAVVDAEAMKSLGRCLAAAIPLWVGVQALTCAMYFLISSELWAVFAAVSVFAVLPVVLYFSALIAGDDPAGSMLMWLYEHMPIVVLRAVIAVRGNWALCGKAWQIGSVWVIAFTVIGIWRFKRKELR